MPLISKVVKSQAELAQHIQTHRPSFYTSSKTSTVIPYDFLEEQLLSDDLKQEYYLVDLSQLPGKCDLTKTGNLIVTGAVSWSDARAFLQSKNRNIKTAPTEDLALICAGVSTSATGERCFKFGNLRSQIVRLKYIDFNGDEIELYAENELNIDAPYFKKFQEDYSFYKDFKNAPYPRFEKETDLMIGTEGQLGIVTEVELETTERVPVTHLFMKLPKWEEDISAHIEIATNIQKWRDEVILCEMIDSNSFGFLPTEDQPVQDADAIFFEIQTEAFEKFYQEFILKLTYVSEENIFELTESKFHQIRSSVPRAIFEENSRQGVIKMGTDIQINVELFETLLKKYQELTKAGIPYNLFGHFGDCHLHFNYMPKPSDLNKCQSIFETLYTKVIEWKGSPFAEHGIGLIKQKYIKQFYNNNQNQVFTYLKKLHDPHLQFFPQGFMNV